MLQSTPFEKGKNQNLSFLSPTLVPHFTPVVAHCSLNCIQRLSTSDCPYYAAIPRPIGVLITRVRPRPSVCLSHAYVISTRNSLVHRVSKTAPFLPRDATHKSGLCRHAMSVCLSVRPFVSFVNHVKTNKHNYLLFHHRVATQF